MFIRYMRPSRASAIFLVSCIFLGWLPGFISPAVVTLDSLKIFKTHEWFKAKPTVYFKCKDENRTELPDVKEANVLYKFKEEESWQPLTEISSKKCKRCGFYEKDDITSDDTFDEWEICPSNFAAANGKYTHFKDKELTATLLCPECKTLGSNGTYPPTMHYEGRHGMIIVIVIMVSSLVSIALIFGLVAAFKYWQKRKREKEQARFLKLFEDGDELEDEMGLDHII